MCAQAVKEEDLGQVDIDDEANARRGKMYIPNWFSVEVKTGVRGNHNHMQLPCCIVVREILLIL